jgi:hypothetical protein
MKSEPASVRRERVQRRRAADVRDPRPRRDLTRDVGDRVVGDAQEDELPILAHGDAALREAGDNGRTYAAASSDVH